MHAYLTAERKEKATTTQADADGALCAICVCKLNKEVLQDVCVRMFISIWMGWGTLFIPK